MKTCKKIIAILLTICIIGILLSIFTAVSEVGLLNYFSYSIFANITAEVNSPASDSSDPNTGTPEINESNERNAAKDPEGSSEEDATQNTADAEDTTEEARSNKSTNKDAIRKKKVEEVIRDLPEKMSRETTFWRRFPLDFNNLKVKDLAIFKRHAGESLLEYRFRINSLFSALCTSHAAGLLKDTDWDVLIRETNLCSIRQTISYEMRYLELAEQLALKNNEFDKFLSSSEAELLNIRRGTPRLQDSIGFLTEKGRRLKAYSNYMWLTKMVNLDSLKNPEYSFLKDLWKSTVVDTTKQPAERLPETYTEFYLYLKFPKELLASVVKETNGDPETLKDPEQVRTWLLFKEILKNDPRFFDELKRKPK